MIRKISVVIPARDEQDTIGAVLDELNETAATFPAYEFETLVVVDDLADRTVAVAREKGAQVLLSRQRRGKGNALYFGFGRAAGDVIVTLDSDGSHNPRDLGLFLHALEDGAGLVIGSRVLGGSDDHNVIRLFANALFTVMVSLLFGTTLMDTLNGYKAFRRELLAGYTPRAKGFDVEVEIVAQAIRQGFKVVEVSTHENRRAGGGMKSRAIRDGLCILRACLREGLNYRFWKLLRRRR